MDRETLIKSLKEAAETTESSLKKLLECRDASFPELFDAMAYTTLAGGKRIRAFLVLEFARLCGADPASAVPYACAVEMIHAYSLIHDDLPCMDDDDMRRGKKSNHIVFGEANALLAGDGLLTYAFEVAASNGLLAPEKNAKAVSLLASFAGPRGMVGGQVLDLRGEKEKLSYEELYHVDELKTSALIKASAYLGCVAADGGEKYFEAAEKYGQNIGVVFQIVDDILDVTGDEKTLGKPIGSDKESNKTTFLTYMTIEEAKKYAYDLTEEAKSVLPPDERGDALRELADMLLTRNK